MTPRELQKKYGLSINEFWEITIKKDGKLIGTGTWVIKHDACERIATQEKLVFEQPTICADYANTLCLLGFVHKKGVDDKSLWIWTTGEASPENVQGKGKYYWAMAEKRLKDRLTLKFINAYEYGVYSDSETEDFARKESYHKPEEDTENVDYEMDNMENEPEVKSSKQFIAKPKSRFKRIMEVIVTMESDELRKTAINQAMLTNDFTADELDQLNALLEVKTKKGKK